MSEITPVLALAIAGHVSAGLALGDARLERATAALVAIGGLLAGSSDEPLVSEALNLSSRVSVVKTGRGYAFKPLPDPAPPAPS